VTDAVAMALATGFLGGFGHCIGMCGPIVGSLAIASGPLGPRRSMLGQAAYHAGRVTTYALLGGLLGLTGAFVNVAGRLAGLQQGVAIVAGVLMIVLGLGAAGPSSPPSPPRPGSGAAKATLRMNPWWELKRLEARAAGRVVGLVRELLGGGPGRLYPAGLALGFLPCGLSWTVFLGAAGTGSLAEGFLVALAFGLGTVPALLAAGAAGTWLGVRARGALYRLGGVLVAVMGLLFLVRGLRA